MPRLSGSVERPIYLFFVLAFVLSLVFTTVYFAKAADSVELAISPNDITINTTETKSVDIIITNNQDVADTFSISVWPPTPWAGVTPNLQKDKVSVEAHSNSTTKLYLSVSSSAEEVVPTFLITVKSTNFEGVNASSAVTVRVRRKTLVYVSGLSVDKGELNPGDCVNITPSVTNDDSLVGTYRLQVSVKKGTSVIKNFDEDVFQLGGKSIKTIPKIYCFDKYEDAGSYLVEAVLNTELNKFIDSREVSLKLKELSNLVIAKSMLYTPFIEVRTIDIKNEGNMIETNFNVTETLSEFTSRFFYPVDVPTATRSENGNTIYIWNIEELRPGKEMQIKYEVRFTSLWIAGIALVVIVFLAFTLTYRPRVSKSVRFIGPLKKGTEMVVLLEVKNSTLKEIKNVVVEDSVSPIATLIEQFDTMTPTINKSEAGTTVAWKIKSLKPFEERVLTYRARPKVDIIGSMRLPRATMSYLNSKMEKKVVGSRSIEIK